MVLRLAAGELQEPELAEWLRRRSAPPDPGGGEQDQ